MSALNTQPFGALRVSVEFLHAASCVRPLPKTELEEFNQRLTLVPYYLVGHSIELALKAFLLGRGEAAGELRSRRFGHNLNALLGRARRRRLGQLVKLSEAQIANIRLLNECYEQKELEYSFEGARRLPGYSAVYHVATTLHAGLRPYCNRLAGLRHTPPASANYVSKPTAEDMVGSSTTLPRSSGLTRR